MGGNDLITAKVRGLALRQPVSIGDEPIQGPLNAQKNRAGRSRLRYLELRRYISPGVSRIPLILCHGKSDVMRNKKAIVRGSGTQLHLSQIKIK